MSPLASLMTAVVQPIRGKKSNQSRLFTGNQRHRGQRETTAHLLSGKLEVLVDAGSQKACIAVTFHECEYVLLKWKGKTDEGCVGRRSHLNAP